MRYLKDPYFLFCSGLSFIALMNCLFHSPLQSSSASAGAQQQQQQVSQQNPGNTVGQTNRQIASLHAQQVKQMGNSMAAVNIYKGLKGAGNIVDVGSDILDDTQNITTAIHMLPQGGMINVKKGNFYVRSFALIHQDLTITGKDDSIIYFMDGGFMQTRGNLHLENLTLVGPLPHAILSANGQKLTMKNVIFKNATITLGGHVRAEADNIAVLGRTDHRESDDGRRIGIRLMGHSHLTINNSEIQNVETAFAINDKAKVNAQDIVITSVQEGFTFTDASDPSKCNNCSLYLTTKTASHDELLIREKI